MTFYADPSFFALLALDSGAYDIPENTAGTTQATRDGYVDYILNAELPGIARFWTLKKPGSSLTIWKIHISA